MTFEVVTVTNKEPEADYYCWKEFHDSLERFGVKPTILGFGQEWKGLMTKPRRLREWLRADKCNAECLIVVDSWDLVFVRRPECIVNGWNILGRPWMIGGERNLFPSANESAYPKCASSYRFPNSGFIVSTPSDMLTVLEDMNLDSIPDDGVDPSNWHPNDQEEYQKAFLRQPIPMRIDTETKFVWNLHGVDESNMDFITWGNPETGKSVKTITNRETHTDPCVIHFNGSSKDTPPGMRQKILKHLGL